MTENNSEAVIKNTKAMMKAFKEARQNVYGKRRGLALLAAYEDHELDQKFLTDYCRLMHREGVKPY